MTNTFQTILVFACMTGLSRAAVVNIDFNHHESPVTHTGGAAAPDGQGSAAIWNSIVKPARKNTIHSGNLLDSSGNLTSIALSLGINGSYSAPAGDQERGSGSSSLMSDYGFLSSGSNQLVHEEFGVLTGLVTSNSYDLYFYGQGDKFSGNVYRGQNTLFTLGVESKQTGWDGIRGGDGAYVEGIEYVRFSAVADPNGQIAFTWANVIAGPGGNVPVDLDGSPSMYGAINGLQIVEIGAAAVPELSTSLLTSLGLLALLRRRRAR